MALPCSLHRYTSWSGTFTFITLAVHARTPHARRNRTTLIHRHFGAQQPWTPLTYPGEITPALLRKRPHQVASQRRQPRTISALPYHSTDAARSLFSRRCIPRDSVRFTIGTVAVDIDRRPGPPIHHSRLRRTQGCAQGPRGSLFFVRWDPAEPSRDTSSQILHHSVSRCRQGTVFTCRFRRPEPLGPFRKASRRLTAVNFLPRASGDPMLDRLLMDWPGCRSRASPFIR